MTYSIFSSFKNLSMNWEKTCFQLRTIEFWTHWNFRAYHRIFDDLRKGPVNTLFPLSTQTDNYMYRKSVTTKKSIIFNKMGLKFRNSTFYIFLQNKIYKMPILWNSEVNKVILEQVKVAVILYDYMLSNFFGNKIWTPLFLVIILLFIWNHLEKHFLQHEHHTEILVYQ